MLRHVEARNFSARSGGAMPSGWYHLQDSLFRRRGA